MAKTDWKNSDIVKPDDMNQIGQEINHLYTEIKDRLDTVKTSDMTLQPGLQVVNAGKDTRFRLGEVRGRTLINFSGNWGDFESLNGLTAWQSTLALDSANKTNGSFGIKVTIGTGFTIGGARCPDIPVYAGRYYVAIGNVKNGNASSVQLQMPGIGGIVSPEYTDASKFATVWRKFSPTSDISSGPTVLVNGAAGTYAYADEVRVYEITAAEYTAIDGMTPEQVAGKYPFVPSGIRGVDNPYAICTSDNLLPPFYDSWVTSSNANITLFSDYEIILHTTGTAQEYVHIPGYRVLPNTTYTFSAEHNAGLNIHAPGVGTIVSNYKGGSVTFNTGSATSINVAFVNGNTSGTAGDYSIINPMLVMDSEAKPFQPQRKSMLAFQTELHASPKDGSDPDVLFEQGGQYFKLAKWRKSALNVNFSNVSNAMAFASGAKLIKLENPALGGVANTGFVTKYDGKALKRLVYGTNEDLADWFVSGDAGDVWISIANTDSGWGDGYTPTADEIKAYFMGWKMYDVNVDPTGGGVYNRNDGVGKWWCPIDRSSSGVQVLPTTRVPTVAPYQLLYRLAKETVEPVVSEGYLMLSEGDNMIEVGTGIVLRERANVYYTAVQNAYYINNTKMGTSALKNKADDILTIYRDNLDDTASWEINGNEWANIVQAWMPHAERYHQDAAYSVTYIKLDKSPIQPITGTLAVNEKAQISDLTAGVAEALQRVSVVEQKKAEKDLPGWMTPMLLNNWQSLLGFGFRIEGDRLFFRGAIRAGVTTAFTELMRLGVKTRGMTIGATTFSTSTGETTSIAIDILENGTIRLVGIAKEVIVFEGLTATII